MSDGALAGIVIAGILIAARRHDLALRVELERAVARVGVAAVGHLHLEEALAVDREVERVAGLLQVALRVDALRGDRRTPVPTCRPVGSWVCCVEVAPGWRTVWYSRSSNTARTLEAVGADVGEVVGDDVELRLLRIEAGLGNPEGTKHCSSPSMVYACRSARASVS